MRSSKKKNERSVIDLFCRKNELEELSPFKLYSPVISYHMLFLFLFPLETTLVFFSCSSHQLAFSKFRLLSWFFLCTFFVFRSEFWSSSSLPRMRFAISLSFDVLSFLVLSFILLVFARKRRDEK